MSILACMGFGILVTVTLGAIVMSLLFDDQDPVFRACPCCDDTGRCLDTGATPCRWCKRSAE